MSWIIEWEKTVQMCIQENDSHMKTLDEKIERVFSHPNRPAHIDHTSIRKSIMALSATPDGGNCCQWVAQPEDVKERGDKFRPTHHELSSFIDSHASLKHAHLEKYHKLTRDILQLYKLIIKEGEEKVLKKYKMTLIMLADNRKVYAYQHTNGRRFFKHGSYRDGSLILKDVDLYNMYIRKTQAFSVSQSDDSFASIYGGSKILSETINTIRKKLLNLPTNNEITLDGRDLKFINLYRKTVFWGDLERVVSTITNNIKDESRDFLEELTNQKIALLKIGGVGGLEQKIVECSERIIREISQTPAASLDIRVVIFIHHFMYMFENRLKDIVGIKKRIISYRLDPIQSSSGIRVLQPVPTSGVDEKYLDTRHTLEKERAVPVELSKDDRNFLLKYMKDGLKYRKSFKDIDGKYRRRIDRLTLASKLGKPDDRVIHKIFPYISVDQRKMILKYIHKDHKNIDEVEEYRDAVKTNYRKECDERFRVLMEEDTVINLTRYLFNRREGGSSSAQGGDSISNVLVDNMYYLHKTLKTVLNYDIHKYPYKEKFIKLIKTTDDTILTDEDTELRRRLLYILNPEAHKKYYIGSTGILIDSKNNRIPSRLDRELIYGGLKVPTYHKLESLKENLISSYNNREEDNHDIGSVPDQGDGRDGDESEGYGSDGDESEGYGSDGDGSDREESGGYGSDREESGGYGSDREESGGD